MNETANASSWSATGRSDPAPDHLEVDLLASGLLPPLPMAYLCGRDVDLLDPLRMLPPGEPLPRRGADSPTHRVDRRELARGLEVANQAYGHPRASDLARRLADPATRVVVTGQQPGLFGGPLYALTKMVAAGRWAAEIEARGEPAVAVFWVATEDHDWDEVTTTTLPGRDGVETFSLGPDPDPLMPVGMRTVGPHLERLYEEIRKEMEGGDRFDDWLALLQRFYRPDTRFGEAFCRLMTALLGERTPLLLDSMLPQVKTAQRPWLARLVERRQAVEEALATSDREIHRRGYELQVEPQRGVSPLFALHRGERRRIEWGGGGWSLRGLEGAGGSVAELLERIEENPAAVSPGVLARPAVQDAILGTSLHLMGPAELSYMTQVAAVYPVLEIEAPWVGLRPQTLILEAHQVEQLEQVGVSLAELLGDREALEKRLAERAGSNPVEAAGPEVEAILERLKAPIVALDPNLERPWEKTRDHILRGLSTLAGKVTSAMARRDQTQARRLDRLQRACLPLGQPQERVISASFFAAKYRHRFPTQVWEQMELDPRRLQVVTL